MFYLNLFTFFTVCHYLVNFNGKLKKAMKESENEDVRDYQIVDRRNGQEVCRFWYKKPLLRHGEFLESFFRGKVGPKVRRP